MKEKIPFNADQFEQDVRAAEAAWKKGKPQHPVLLFIGGPADGQRHEVPDDRNDFQVPIFRKMPEYAADDPWQWKYRPIGMFDYFRKIMQFQDRQHGPIAEVHVFAPRGMTDEKLYQLLVENYRRPNGANQE